jgi:hypothetical protein
VKQALDSGKGEGNVNLARAFSVLASKAWCFPLGKLTRNLKLRWLFWEGYTKSGFTKAEAGILRPQVHERQSYLLGRIKHRWQCDTILLKKTILVEFALIFQCWWIWYRKKRPCKIKQILPVLKFQRLLPGRGCHYRLLPIQIGLASLFCCSLLSAKPNRFCLIIKDTLLLFAVTLPKYSFAIANFFKS